MNIYLVTQDVNNEWDTFDAMVVIAKNQDSAKTLTIKYTENEPDTWAELQHLKADLLGKAEKGIEEKIVFQSYIAG